MSYDNIRRNLNFYSSIQLNGYFGVVPRINKIQQILKSKEETTFFFIKFKRIKRFCVFFALDKKYIETETRSEYCWKNPGAAEYAN